MDKIKKQVDLGTPIGALPVRIKSLNFLLVFTDKALVFINYATKKRFLIGGQLLEIRRIVKISKGKPEEILEVIKEKKKITGFIPYDKLLEIRLERGFLGGLNLIIKDVKGKEIKLAPIYGKGTGITRDEFIGLLRKFIREVNVKAIINV